MSEKMSLAHARAFFSDSLIIGTQQKPIKTAALRLPYENQLCSKLGKSSDSWAQNRHFLGKNRVKLGNFQPPKFIYSTTKTKREGL